MKFMLDTNAFDFIYNHNLIDDINNLIVKNKISLFTTHIQKDELEKMPNEEKKEKIKKIVCTQLVCSVGMVGTDDDTKRGFMGSRMGEFQLIGEDDKKILDKIQTKPTVTHPLGNGADISILFTAIKNEINYLVSDDRDIHENTKKLDSNFKILSNLDFKKMIKRL